MIGFHTPSFVDWYYVVCMPCITLDWLIDKLIKPARFINNITVVWKTIKLEISPPIEVFNNIRLAGMQSKLVSVLLHMIYISTFE